MEFPPPTLPAECRPQAWTAASAVAVLGAALGLTPDVLGGHELPHPARTADGAPLLGAVEADGVVIAGGTTRIGVGTVPPAVDARW